MAEFAKTGANASIKMDHHSTLDHSSPEPPGAKAGVIESDAGRSPIGTVSAPLVAAPARVLEPALRFAGDDGPTLSQIAQRDLDAALQLLAERAQYITGATGAAIALRRGLHNDMLCRASAGSNAPDLGALLSAESGLSGESVRVRLPLCCDDADRDPRVNREGCRELGIASVAVMPIVSDDQVLGVFELFSGKVNAFGERDLSALQRLGEMVETAVKLAHPAPKLSLEVLAPQPEEDVEPAAEVEAAAPAPKAEAVAASLPATEPKQVHPAEDPATIRPLFWSAAASAASSSIGPEPDQSHVPAALKNLHTCKACGFPISEGRILCVECEEKRWRGQLRPPYHQTATAASRSLPASQSISRANAAEAPPPVSSTVAAPGGAPASAQAHAETPVRPTVTAASSSARPRTAGPDTRHFPSTVQEHATVPAGTPAPLPLFSSGISASESWLSANKYILAAAVVVVIVVAAIALLR